MKAFYLKLIDQLTKSAEVKASFIDKKLDPIKAVDLYKGQYLNPKIFEMYPQPCVFMDWTILYDSDNSKNPSKVQIGIHLSIEQLRDTSSLSKQLSKSLLLFDYIDETHKAVKKITTPITGKLRLVDEGVVDEASSLSIYKITYQAEYSGRKEDAMEDYDCTDGEGEIEMQGELIDHFEL